LYIFLLTFFFINLALALFNNIYVTIFAVILSFFFSPRFFWHLISKLYTLPPEIVFKFLGLNLPEDLNFDHLGFCLDSKFYFICFDKKNRIYYWRYSADKECEYKIIAIQRVISVFILILFFIFCPVHYYHLLIIIHEWFK